MDWPKLGIRFKPLSPGLMLAVILAVALGLRLYGIDWDQGHGFHPDERSLYMRADCMYRVLTESPGYADCTADHPEMEPGVPSLSTALDADRSPLNPHWFPLGSILIYLILAIRLVLEPFMDLGSLLSMAYIGRSIVALADVGTVLMVYLLGKRIFGQRVGLLASALVTLSVVHIQHSHFYRPEPLLIFFVLVSFWFMLQLMERRRLRDSLLLGLFVGLTLAVKVSVLPLVLPLALAYGFRLSTTHDGRWAMPYRAEADRVMVHALLAGAAAVVVFLITTPYALLDIFEFVAQITWQVSNVAKTAGNVPFTVQYVGTTPFLYELRQTSLWALGLPLGIVAWGGLLFTILFAISRIFKFAKNGLACRGELLLLAWVIPNLILLSSFEVKFLRYIFPLMPFLILMGSGMLFWMLDRARSTTSLPTPSEDNIARAGGLAKRYAPHMVVGIIAFVVGATAFYALAFETIYSRPHPAVQASQWINRNVPTNATIITDNHWDEPIPDIYGYRVRQIPIYERDTMEKMDIIAGHLSDGDYLIFYSNRTYGSVARLPERYPLSSQYYRLLFSGDLGYSPEKAFTSYPQLLGLTFVDDTFSRAGISEPESLKALSHGSWTLNLGYADENVINYDHPKVLLFRNVGRLSRAQLSRLLTEKLPEERPQLGLMLDPQQKAAQRHGGTWTDIIKRDSWTNDVPILAWLLLVELIYIATLPLATFLFRPLPDRGMILARILGILGVSYVAWLLASLGWLGFSRTSVLVGILAVAFLSALVLATRWREFKEWLVRNWRLIAIGEAIFLVAFLSFVAIRMANPDLWHPYRGGEKPMDFAYLNAVLRSTYMPPFDPWFAGGYLNYYYWGQFIVATLIKGTGIVPSVAYNLAVPMLFALTVTGAYSLIYNVTAGIRRLRPIAGEPPSLSMVEGHDGGGFPLPLTPSHQEREIPGEDFPHQSPGDSRSWRRWVEGISWGPVVAGLLAGLFVAVMANLDGLIQLIQGAWKSLTTDAVFPAFDFWRSSRMLPQSEDITPSALTFWLPDKLSPNPEIGHHITEFPFFSFLFADLHAHLIVIPFTLLAIGLAFSLMLGLRRGNRWWLAATATALAVAVGSLWAINSWDYPTYLLLALVVIGAGVYLMRDKPLKRLGMFLALGLGVVLLSILAFLPFHMNYHPFPAGLDVSKWQTPIQNYLGTHGLFLFLIGTFLIYMCRRQLKGLLGFLARPWPGTKSPSSSWPIVGTSLGKTKWVSWTMMAGVVGTVLIIYMATAGYWTAALLTLFLVLTAWVTKGVLSSEEEGAPYAALPLAMIGMALLIGIGVEFVRTEGDIGRMNTLFKYYLEAWVLLGMASAYVVWYLASSDAFRPRGMSLARGAWLAALIVLLAASFIYPILGTRSRLADRFSTENMTLDGADYMKTAVYSKEGPAIELRWDYEAIRWLQDNVKGSPVVLEAHNEQYRWSSRISDYTGLPTILGWPWHQIQQRMKYSYAIGDRRNVVNEIYSTVSLNRALKLLKRYEVEYVVVGQLERAYYPAEGLGKFDSMAREGLARLVYENEGIKIYQAMWYN